MRERLKRGFYHFQRLLRRDRALYKEIERDRRLVVLNLHQVTPYANPYWPGLHPNHFDDLLSFLKEGFHVIRLRDLKDCDTDKPPAVLSFDDGYYDFLEYAAPVLLKHGLKANMNIVPSCVESGLPIWNVRLYDFLSSVSPSQIDRLHIPGYNGRLRGDSPQDKLKFGLSISSFLKNRPRLEREEIWSVLTGVIDLNDTKMTRMLNREEIRQMAVEHEIGVHSFSHESMGIEEDGYFRDDLAKCVSYFDSELRIPLEVYAFPNGSFRDSQIQILLGEGIKYVLLVNEDYADPNSRVIPRLTIYGRSSIEAQFQALGINRRK